MAQAAFLPAALGLLTKHHHIVWVGKTEQGARPLIEHVRVKFVGLQECNATLPALSLGFSVPQFRGERAAASGESVGWGCFAGTLSR